MAREYFEIEKGLRITDENSDSGVEILQGDGVPVGTSGDTADAGIGALYSDRTNGRLYQKRTSTNSAGDWLEIANTTSLIDPSWRNEKVIVATGEALSVGTRNLTTTPFTDDDTPFLVAGDFTVGQYVIGGVGGTPVLYEVTTVSSPNITLALASEVLADSDVFVVRNYLPDSPDGQEKQAIVTYQDTNIVKIADFNFAIADGIGLTSGYASTNGAITNADTVDSAIRKLDGNQQDIQTTLGVAQGDVDLGTFTGNVIPDNSTIKNALQSLETYAEGLGVVNATVNVMRLFNA
jgi:hypothetical protein